MAASASVVLGLVYDQLNTSRAAYNTWDESNNGLPRWQQAALVNWAADADLEIQRVICETEGSSYRNNYVQPPANVTNGGALPASMIGPVQAVFIDGVLGKEGQSEWINYFNEDTDNVFGGAAYTGGFYSIIGNRLYFSGAAAQVYFCTAARATVPALPALPTLASPEAFTNSIVKAVCGWACLKEQDYLTEGQMFLEQYMTDLNSIRQGAMTVPPVQQAMMAGA